MRLAKSSKSRKLLLQLGMTLYLLADITQTTVVGRVFSLEICRKIGEQHWRSIIGTQWQLQEAENRFDEIVEEALANGPQTVTRHGRPIVVIMSAAEYHKITLTRNTLVEFLQNSPLAEVELNIRRDNEM